MKGRSLLSLWTLVTVLTFSARAEPQNCDAWISQNLITLLGQTVTYESPLYTEKGSMQSVPMNGLMARFDLYVYPLAGIDGAPPKPTIVDTEVTGILPRVVMEFDGRDPHEEPRTRSDWTHTVTTTILDSPLRFRNPLSLPLPGWLSQFVMRKRFLAAEHIGAEDSEDHWEEYECLPVLHVSLNQEITFSDNAWPPNLQEDERDTWSGIIEYQLALDAVLGCPVPLLTLARMQVRVWPKWTTDFVNFPSTPVPQLPDDMRVDVGDIYPASEKVIVEYFYDPNGTGDYEDLVPVNLFDEPWVASVAQDRKYPLAALSEQAGEGDYYVRVGCLLFGEMEYADDWAGLQKMTLKENKLSLRAGLYALE
ncbi:hypothetical protein AAFN60_04580 [Roseibacillus persicicus]|uniref:hypothetical protein n=1 Tax=Roseibacillus persicicus TaxID=454148 RepID=UPI00398B02FC